MDCIIQESYRSATNTPSVRSVIPTGCQTVGDLYNWYHDSKQRRGGRGGCTLVPWCEPKYYRHPNSFGPLYHKTVQAGNLILWYSSGSVENLSIRLPTGWIPCYNVEEIRWEPATKSDLILWYPTGSNWLRLAPTGSP